MYLSWLYHADYISYCPREILAGHLFVWGLIVGIRYIGVVADYLKMLTTEVFGSYF